MTREGDDRPLLIVVGLALFFAAIVGYFLIQRVLSRHSSPVPQADEGPPGNFSPPDGVVVMPMPRLTAPPKRGSKKGQPTPPPSPD